MCGRVCVVTGGAGTLCSSIAEALAQEGTRVALVDVDEDRALETCRRIGEASGSAIAVRADVLVRDDLERALAEVLEEFGAVDVLINGAGGNHPRATTSGELSFFDLSAETVRKVLDLNFMGTLLPSQIIGRRMAEQSTGVILNIASMGALRPLTHVPAYSAAKAAVANFTQWLAVYMAQEYSPRIRVNAIAPGFLISEQNRFLLQQENGQLTKRGQRILDHTPMARFGEPCDLIGAVEWLISPKASFVTGVVLPIDGGFAAYAGV